MHSYEENSHLPLLSHRKSPYSRQNTRKLDPTVNKIVSQTRTSENNYGRSLVPIKTLDPKYPFLISDAQFLPNYHESPTSYASENSPDWRLAYDLHSHHKSNQSDYECEDFRYSLEVKTMNVGAGSEVSENPKTTNFTEVSQEIHAKSFEIKPGQNQLHLFTGSVDNLMHWYKLKSSLHILFEVTATIISIQPGNRETEKYFWISDSKSGPKLQVVFYEIDRPVPKLRINSLVTCIGRLITRNRLQAYKVEESSEEQRSDLERLSFICNRVADEIVSAGQEN